MIKYSEGNPFAQGMSDGTALENHSKYLAFGIQFIDHELLENHALTLGLVRIHGGSNENAFKTMSALSASILGLDYKEICYTTTADRAAMGIAELFDHDKDPCGIHDNDKLAKSMCGDLVRTKNKINKQ